MINIRLKLQNKIFVKIELPPIQYVINQSLQFPSVEVILITTRRP